MFGGPAIGGIDMAVRVYTPGHQITYGFAGESGGACSAVSPG
jgi:hypothetical protein